MSAGDPNPVQVQFVPRRKQARPPTPLVLIHDGGGTIFSYFLLGSLHRDVWAIYDPKYFDGAAWEGGMDQMARHYIGLLVETGITGSILLGGWSLGGLLSLTMAHMLAHDPSATIAVAGIVLIDSPFHVASSKLTMKTSEPKIGDTTPLVQKSFENCDAMLKNWELPRWDGPSGGGKEARVVVAGQSFTLRPGNVLYKPLGEDWKTIRTQQYQHDTRIDKPITPPPGVMIRCTRPTAKMEGSGPEPASIDLYRAECLLGWEDNHPDFLQAIIDVDDDHYRLFDKYDEEKVSPPSQRVQTLKKGCG